MIVALLNRKRGVNKTMPAPHVSSQSSRQRKRTALIDADLQRAELDRSRHQARRHRHRLLSVIGFVRRTPDRAVAGLAGHPDHIIIAGLPCRGLAVLRASQRGVTVADTLRDLSARKFPHTNGERS